MSELLAIGSDFVEKMDIALSGAGWLRADPVSTNTSAGSASQMLAEGTAVAEDSKAFRALVGGATETKGLSAISGIDMSTDRGVALMDLMRMQNKIIDLDEMEMELKSSLKEVSAMSGDDILAVRPVFMERYSEYVNMMKAEIPEIEQYLRDHTIPSPMLSLASASVAEGVAASHAAGEPAAGTETAKGAGKGKSKGKTSGRATEEPVVSRGWIGCEAHAQ
eukprot:6300470-Amphidinium_carterae.1